MAKHMVPVTYTGNPQVCLSLRALFSGKALPQTSVIARSAFCDEAIPNECFRVSMENTCIDG